MRASVQRATTVRRAMAGHPGVGWGHGRLVVMGGILVAGGFFRLEPTDKMGDTVVSVEKSKSPGY